MFSDGLEFFEDVVKFELNWELLFPNSVKLLRLAMIHPANFRLQNMIKTKIQATMINHRLNHLCDLKHHKKILKKECNVEELMCDFAARNDRRKKNFWKIPVKKK